MRSKGSAHSSRARLVFVRTPPSSASRSHENLWPVWPGTTRAGRCAHEIDHCGRGPRGPLRRRLSRRARRRQPGLRGPGQSRRRALRAGPGRIVGVAGHRDGRGPDPGRQWRTEDGPIERRAAVPGVLPGARHVRRDVHRAALRRHRRALCLGDQRARSRRALRSRSTPTTSPPWPRPGSSCSPASSAGTFPNYVPLAGRPVGRRDSRLPVSRPPSAR